MIKKTFEDVDILLATQHKIEAYFKGNHEIRQKLRNSTLYALETAHECSLDANQGVFLSIVNQRYQELTEKQKTIVVSMCLDLHDKYACWKQELAAEEREIREKGPLKAPVTITPKDRGIVNLHGGSGYTGRLPVGYAAPAGSESFQSDDEPRTGMMAWVDAVTAGGAGAGFSLAELSSARHPKSYDAPIPLNDLTQMRRGDLESLMDRATDQATFLRAFLAYYGQPMNVDLGNTSINSSNINNPENVRSMSNLDSLYSYMRRLDDHKIITPERAARFLVMCHDILKKAGVNYPRSGNKRTHEIYEERERELRMAKMEIESKMKNACFRAGVEYKEIRDRIFFQRKRGVSSLRYDAPSAGNA